MAVVTPVDFGGQTGQFQHKKVESEFFKQPQEHRGSEILARLFCLVRPEFWQTPPVFLHGNTYRAVQGYTDASQDHHQV